MAAGLPHGPGKSGRADPLPWAGSATSVERDLTYSQSTRLTAPTSPRSSAKVQKTRSPHRGDGFTLPSRSLPGASESKALLDTHRRLEGQSPRADRVPEVGSDDSVVDQIRQQFARIDPVRRRGLREFTQVYPLATVVMFDPGTRALPEPLPARPPSSPATSRHHRRRTTTTRLSSSRTSQCPAEARDAPDLAWLPRRKA